MRPLTDGERNSLFLEQLRLALTHLHEARALANLKETPHACVHSSYYAMYHLATAIILQNGGVNNLKNAPKNHHEIIMHFGKLNLVQKNSSLELGQLLSRARVDRTVADYGLERRISMNDAKATMADAETFFENCAALFNITYPDETDTLGK